MIRLPGPCRWCGRLACTAASAALCIAVGATTFVTPLAAQSGGGRSIPVATRATVDIGSVFVMAPNQPMLAALPSGNGCGGGDCYGGQITVRANQRWQLQVRLDPTIQLPASVAWRPPVTSVANQPLDATWLTILTGPVPTAGTDVTLQFAVSQNGGAAPSGEPFVQLLSMAVQYRVVSW